MSMFNKTRDEFENSISSQGIHYSRYIASWAIVGGNVKRLKDFLRRLGLPEEEIQEIYNLATNGKLELETAAKLLLKEASTEGL